MSTVYPFEAPVHRLRGHQCIEQKASGIQNHILCAANLFRLLEEWTLRGRRGGTCPGLFLLLDYEVFPIRAYGTVSAARYSP